VFPLWVSRLDATCLHKIAYLALLDWILALHIVPRIRYLGFTTRGKKGPLTTTGDLSACKSKRTLIQLLTVNREIDGSRAGGREGRKDVPDFARHFILFRSIHIEIEIRECVCVCVSTIQYPRYGIVIPYPSPPRASRSTLPRASVSFGPGFFPPVRSVPTSAAVCSLRPGYSSAQSDSLPIHDRWHCSTSVTVWWTWNYEMRVATMCHCGRYSQMLMAR
jgi:hypothetical protein